MWQQYNFHIIYKVTSIDGIPAATHHCLYLEKNNEYQHGKLNFLILILNLRSSFVRNISKIKKRKTPLHPVHFAIYNKPTPMASYCSHNNTFLFYFKEENTRLPLISLSHLLLTPSLQFPFFQRKCRRIFHLLHELDWGQKFEFIVGRDTTQQTSNFCLFLSFIEEL